MLKAVIFSPFLESESQRITQFGKPLHALLEEVVQRQSHISISSTAAIIIV